MMLLPFNLLALSKIVLKQGQGKDWKQGKFKK